MSITARDGAVDKFTKDSDCRMLLMILKDGGIALDIKVASHVRIHFLTCIYLLNKHMMHVILGGSSFHLY